MTVDQNNQINLDRLRKYAKLATRYVAEKKAWYSTAALGDFLGYGSSPDQKNAERQALESLSGSLWTVLTGKDS